MILGKVTQKNDVPPPKKKWVTGLNVRCETVRGQHRDTDRHRREFSGKDPVVRK